MVDAVMEDVPDLPVLLKASAEFASYPGQHSDASVKEFLDRFPLPLIFSALSLKSDVPGLESSLVSCLEMIFRTKYGISHVPEYMLVSYGYMLRLGYTQEWWLSDEGVIFPTDGDDPTHLKNVAEHSSSSARIRVFSLIAKLFSTSASASAIHSSGLLDLLVAEVKNSNDVLMTLSTLEVLYEVG
ncbi:hypothetical protein EJ110_NYTH52714 [Nymphaea thermarum]|nr:hypothetical protein EJ110_NYTH52714 [Nymphaea thermarum]